MALYHWGSNKFGQLGTDTSQAKCFFSPGLVDGLQGIRIKSVAAGEGHTVIATEFGEVLTIGRGREGQLGVTRPNSTIGIRDDQITLQQVTALENENIVDVSCGAHSSMALTSSGRVYMWGLIHEDTDPDTLNAAMGNTELATDLNSMRGERGEILNRVVAHSRNVWQMAKREEYTDLDDLTEEAKASLQKSAEEIESEYQGIMKVNTIRQPVPAPRLCLSLRGVRVAALSSGYGHAMALGADGRLWAYGYNDKGQLGLGHRINSSNFLPVEALRGARVLQVACGQHHTLARVAVGPASGPDDEGAPAACYAWGSHALGQLGLGRMYTGRGRLRPQRVHALEEGAGGGRGARVAHVAAGGNHSAAVVGRGANSMVYSWGHGEYGQHGRTLAEGRDYLIDSHHYYEPQPVEALRGCGVARVACGAMYTLGLGRGGEVWSWGWNAWGVLGTGADRADTAPERVAFPGLGLGGAGRAIRLAAGADHCACVVSVPGMDRVPVLGPLVDAAPLASAEGEGAAAAAVLRVGLAAAAGSGSGGGGRGAAFWVHPEIVAARCPYLGGYLRTAAAAVAAEGGGGGGGGGNGEDAVACWLPAEMVDDATVFRAFLDFLYTDRFELPRHKRRKLRMLAIAVNHSTLERRCMQGMSYLELRKSGGHAPVTPEYEGPADEFEADMIRLLESGPNRDVEITFGETTMLCHSFILYRLEFFQRLLLGGFREGGRRAAGGGRRSADLSNFAAEGVSLAALRRVLRYLYTGARRAVLLEGEQGGPVDPNTLMEVVVAAGLLGIEYLVKVCEAQLSTFVLDSMENATHCLDFALQYDLPRLALQCKEILQDAEESAIAVTEEALANIEESRNQRSDNKHSNTRSSTSTQADEEGETKKEHADYVHDHSGQESRRSTLRARELWEQRNGLAHVAHHQGHLAGHHHGHNN